MKEKPAIFLLKVLALSLILFILWYWKGERYYLSIFSGFLNHFLSIFGLGIQILWYPSEIFHNLIPFISLMLLSRDIHLKRRITKSAIGLLILIADHILLSIGVYLLHHNAQTSPSATDYNYKFTFLLYTFSEILPFLLWVILAKRNLLKLFMSKKTLAINN